MTFIPVASVMNASGCGQQMVEQLAKAAAICEALIGVVEGCAVQPLGSSDGRPQATNAAQRKSVFRAKFHFWLETKHRRSKSVRSCSLAERSLLLLGTVLHRPVLPTQCEPMRTGH
jgi:hypothetical protein